MDKDRTTEWIWIKDWTLEDGEAPRQVYFRKEIHLSAPVKGELKISADSRYKLYINEKLVEVGPSKGDRQIWYYDAIDITNYLSEGLNAFAVKVLRYPLNHSKGNHGIFRTGTPGLFVSGEFTNAEGSVQRIDADETWRCLIDPNFEIISESAVFAPLQIYEKVTGDAKNADWLKAGFDAGDWPMAMAYQPNEMSRAVSPGNLHPRTIPFMYRKKRNFEKIMTLRKSVHPKEAWERFLCKQQRVVVAPNSKEIIEISAGEEMTGYLQLAVSGGHSAKINILQSEAYVQNEKTVVNGLEIPVKEDREDYLGGHLEGFSDAYTVAGYGTEQSPECYAPFWFRTFRFIGLEIETEDEELVLEAFDYVETGYPLEVSTSFESSDESLSAIWEISERTLRRCMHETYEDCPFYEQLQYAMDSRLQILYTYAVAADDRLARKCMDDFKRSHRYDGTLNGSYPCYGPNVIPGFSIYYILMLHDHMMYFDDVALLEYHMPTVEGVLNYFERNLKSEGYVGKLGGMNGIDRYWSFIDWTPEWNGTSGVPPATLQGAITMESLLYIMGLQTAAQIAEHLGRSQLASKMEEKAEAVKQALRKYCLGSNGMIQDGPGIEAYSQHVQVFALLTDTLSPQQGKANLLETILHKENYAQCSVAMSFYLYRALQKAELYEMTDDYWNIWRRMIKNNATTCVEAEAGERSECHAWGSLALYELPSVTLGVYPAEPGYKSVVIAPTPGYLTWAKGEVMTPHGLVKVEWKKDGAGLNVSYQVPEGMNVHAASSVDKRKGMIKLFYKREGE